MKTCSSCKKEKPFSEFHKKKSTKTGLSSDCKVCRNEYSKKWRAENKSSVKKNNKDWTSKNPDYYLNYRKKNREKDRIRLEIWREQNKEKILEYRKKNKDKNNHYQRQRRQGNPVHKLSHNLRTLIGNSFNKRKWNKSTKTQEILGASYDDVFKHIESRFKSGMSWDNRGEWHIDHIIPLSSAKTEKELIELCHYTNLQPLWADENLSKGDKIIACRINFN